MEQLGLALANRLPYEARNFFLHEGIHDCMDKISALFKSRSFGVAFIHGETRSGKTHLSIKIGDIAFKKKLFPRYVEGGSFEEWLNTKFLHFDWTDGDDVVIIDDAHLYFSKMKPGDSGAFVNFIETLRWKGAKVIFLSSQTLEKLPCDEHILSRLKPGLGFEIRDPSDPDMPPLVRCMGSQRGMSLKDRQIEFIMKRIGKSIVEVERYFDRVVHLSQVLGRKIRYPILNDAL